MKNLKNYVLLGLLALSLVSCVKDEDASVDQELLVANATFDFASDLDFNSGLQALTDEGSYSSRFTASANRTIPTCPSVTLSTTNGGFPKVFTIDFGDACVQNGITRKGIITVTLTDYFINYGSTMTIERTDNYYVNGRKLKGTVAYQNTTTNTEMPRWTRTVTGGELTTLSGNLFTFSGTRDVQQTEGAGTVALVDNVYNVLSGNNTVNRPNGTSLTVTVVQTLIKKYACDYISQGQLDLQGSFLNGILDYGDNTCDNQATYTHYDGSVYNINL